MLLSFIFMGLVQESEYRKIFGGFKKLFSLRPPGFAHKLHYRRVGKPLPRFPTNFNMDKGKQLERKFSRWCKELDIYCVRFFDSRSIGDIGASRPADFFIFHKRRLSYFELKHITRGSLPLHSIRPSQYKSARIAHLNAIYYYLFVEFNSEIYVIDFQKIFRFIKTEKRKSIPQIWAKSNGFRIRKKQDLLSLLDSENLHMQPQHL